MAQIDCIGFGTIRIDGRKYRVWDVLVFPDGNVRRRKFSRWLVSHHKYDVTDVADLVAAGAESIVIGTGMSRRVRLSDALRRYAEERGIEILDVPSSEVADAYETPAAASRQVGVAVHLTC